MKETQIPITTGICVSLLIIKIFFYNFKNFRTNSIALLSDSLQKYANT